MVPSPRKRAAPTTTSTFAQTWDDTDAAFLDPNSLPISKVPRGWERRKEVKKQSDGKEKQIWRRFNLRSRAAPEAEDDEEEQHDSRSRAVKKLQRMSPKAMDKVSTGPNGRKRAFKTTRWDRRKSVLPRKRTAPIEDSLVDTADAQDDEDDTLDLTRESNDSIIVAEVPVNQTAEPEQSLLEVKDRRTTFTFSLDAATVDDLPDYESLDRHEQEPEQDTTLANFFRSPVKRLSMVRIRSPKKVDYPQLPYSGEQEVDTEISRKNNATSHHMDHSGNDSVTNIGLEQNLSSPEVSMSETNDADREDSPIAAEALPAPNEAMYPALPDNENSLLPSPSNQNVDLEDSEMSDISLDLDMDTAIDKDTGTTSTAIADEKMSEEDFTEASMQLDIQREYEEVQQGEDIVTAAIPEEPQIEGLELQDDRVDSGMGAQEDHEAADAEELVEPRTDDIETTRSATAIRSPARTVQTQLHASSPIRLKEPSRLVNDSIADGLTLSFTPAKPPSADPTPRKLLSPPPSPRAPSGPDDATMTLALDDDTAILKDFLSRAAASKAEKAAIVTHRRESVQNRRDSDVVRHALASPRKVLEDKDPNSPSKYDNDATLDLSQTLTLSMPKDTLASAMPNPEGTEDEESTRGSRRSSRTKKSRLPALASAAQAQTSKINIRRADGNEVVVLQKNDVQELANLTRANTRKNKQGAFGVAVRLLKVAADAIHLSPLDDSTKELVVGKNVRWDEQLAYYQENPDTVAERESLATPDELSMPDPATAAKAKNKTSKNSTPKVRRVRGLGTVNGTPGRGLLAPAAFLPDALQQEKEKEKEAAPAPPPIAPQQQQQLPRHKASKIKKMPVASTSIDSAVSSTLTDTKLPALDVAPVGVQPATTQRRSRLAAPKKVVLPQPLSSLPSEGKENAQRPGIGDATPKKGIPAPKVVVPSTVGMESGLPRRRGRKI